MTTYYTVDIGTNLPYPLPDNLYFLQPPRIVSTRTGKQRGRLRLPSGTHAIHKSHLFPNQAAAQSLLETLTARYEAQDARYREFEAKREEERTKLEELLRRRWTENREQYDSAVETLTALAGQFPQHPDHRRWEIAKLEDATPCEFFGVYETHLFVIHLTPEETETVGSAEIHVLLPDVLPEDDSLGSRTLRFAHSRKEWNHGTWICSIPWGGFLVQSTKYTLEDDFKYVREAIATLTAGVTP